MTEIREWSSFERMRRSNRHLWSPVYGEYSRERLLRRLDEVALAALEGGNEREAVTDALELTTEQANACYDSFEGVGLDAESASFAFVVPSRLSRLAPDFSGEGNSVFPIGAFADPETCQLLWSSLCPIVLDRYQCSDGESGVMIGSPLTIDIVADLGVDRALGTARRIADDAVAFAARRFRPRIVGLGATLPGLTDFGAALTNNQTAVTSGHGGTCALIVDTVAALGRPGDVGIVGLGAIGLAAAQELLARSPSIVLHLFDRNPTRLAEVAELLGSTGRAIACTSVSELILRSEVIVSATTTPVDLDELDVDLCGRWIIDDSQPPCFEPRVVEARGGRICWVVGQDGSPAGTATKTGYWGSVFDYGGRGPAAASHLWGCEGEAHAIALAGTRADCITEPVKLRHTRRIGQLFEAMNTTVAPLQRDGALIVDDTRSPGLAPTPAGPGVPGARP